MFAALCVQTLLVTLSRRLRIAVLLAAGLEVRCWLLMRLIRTGLFDMAFTKYIKRMARTRHSSPPVARGRAHDAFNCARSEQQEQPNRWTSKSSGQASCLSRDHSHASLMHGGNLIIVRVTGGFAIAPPALSRLWGT